MNVSFNLGVFELLTGQSAPVEEEPNLVRRLIGSLPFACPRAKDQLNTYFARWFDHGGPLRDSHFPAKALAQCSKSRLAERLSLFIQLGHIFDDRLD